MILRTIFLAVFSFLFILRSTALLAAEWHVDALVGNLGDGKSWVTAFKTIQEGMDAASEGTLSLLPRGPMSRTSSSRAKTSFFVARIFSIRRLSRARGLWAVKMAPW